MSYENLSEIYSDDFYENQSGSASAAAAVILPLILSWYKPNSVVDVGCGSGDWLIAARELFDANILGIDGNWNETITKTGCPYLHANLEAKLNVQTKYDLAICLEVAEHLSETGGGFLVSSLTEMSDVILFSAAIPGQAGTNHLNCRWQSNWCSDFNELGYDAYDLIRPIIWENPDISFWYKQNILLYIKRGSDRLQALPHSNCSLDAPLDVVHPSYYGKILKWRDQNHSELRNRIQMLENEIYSPPSARFVAGIAKRYFVSNFFPKY